MPLWLCVIKKINNNKIGIKMGIMSDKMMGIMEKLLPSCKTVTKQVSDSLEHKLPLFDRLKVNLHLMGCESCSLYRKQLLILQLKPNGKSSEKSSI